MFATPFERQGSLIHLEPMHANSGASSSTPGQETPQNGADIVYCPIGTPAAKSESTSESQDQRRCAHQAMCDLLTVFVSILVPGVSLAHTQCAMTINCTAAFLHWLPGIAAFSVVGLASRAALVKHLLLRLWCDACCVSLCRGSRQLSEKPKAQSGTKGPPAPDANMGSQGMLFGAGVAIGGVAGALLTYLGSLQRH